MKSLKVSPIWIMSLFFLLYVGVIRLIQLHCFSYYDLGIYSEALNRIQFHDLNPFIPGRNIRILSDHFDPILIPISFFTRFISAPYLGVTVEVFLILLCWHPIRMLRDRGLLSAQKALFAYAFLILNQAMVGAVTWPFHPTTWGVLPLVYVFTFYLLQEWKLLWIAFFVLCTCREEFPLIGFTLVAVLLFDRKFKPAIWILMSALFWTVFLFVFRPRWFGNTSTYGQDLLGEFIRHPFAQLVALLKVDSLRNWSERLIAFILMLTAAQVKRHWKSTLKILIIAAPILGIRYAANKWGAHYGPAALISIFFALLMSYADSTVSKWRSTFSWLLLIVFFMSPTIKNLWDAFVPSHTRFAYKQCPIIEGRLASIDQAQAWIAQSSAQKVLLENNLAPTFLLKNTQKDLFILAGPQTSGGGPYEVVLVEKPSHGDMWGVGPERLTDLIRTWKSIPGVHVIQDDEFVFLAEGVISPDH